MRSTDYCRPQCLVLFFFFFFNDPAPPEISPLPLHDALPISTSPPASRGPASACSRRRSPRATPSAASPSRAAARRSRAASSTTWWASRSRRVRRSEEHTSELQSQSNLVCRLLLEKKKEMETHLPLLTDRLIVISMLMHLLSIMLGSVLVMLLPLLLLYKSALSIHRRSPQCHWTV